ncbi:MAG: MerR family transcriptional regulator [Chloroflexi bacterium]|nr:MerR family transcriptional regulator [Chloroflexota bacterium]
MPERSLVSISEASRILGVSEATLRLWTDEGKIRAFVTPGGHRRYSRADLRRFAGLQGKVRSVKDLVSGLEEAASLPRDIARTSFPATAWYGKLGPESRQNLARCGRRLLDLIVKYITEPSRRDETIRLSQDVGKDFGNELAGLGVPLTDALEAFLMHRTPFIEAATGLMKKREVLSERAVEAIPMVTRVMDEALVSLVAVYQERRGLSLQNKGDSAQ